MEALEKYENRAKSAYEKSHFGISKEIFVCMEGSARQKLSLYESLLRLEAEEQGSSDVGTWLGQISADFVRGDTKLSIYKTLIGLSHCNGVVLCIDDDSLGVSDVLIDYGVGADHRVVLYSYSDTLSPQIEQLTVRGQAYTLYRGRADGAFVDYLFREFPSQKLYYTNRAFIDATVRPEMRVDLKLESLSPSEFKSAYSILRGPMEMLRERSSFSSAFNKRCSRSGVSLYDIATAVLDNRELRMRYDLAPVEIAQCAATSVLQACARSKFKNVSRSVEALREDPSMGSGMYAVESLLGVEQTYKRSAKLLNALSLAEGLTPMYQTSMRDVLRKEFWDMDTSVKQGYRMPTGLEYQTLLFGTDERILHLLGVSTQHEEMYTVLEDETYYAVAASAPSPDFLYDLFSQQLEWGYNPSVSHRDKREVSPYELRMYDSETVMHTLAVYRAVQLVVKLASSMNLLGVYERLANENRTFNLDHNLFFRSSDARDRPSDYVARRVDRELGNISPRKEGFPLLVSLVADRLQNSARQNPGFWYEPGFGIGYRSFREGRAYTGASASFSRYGRIVDDFLLVRAFKSHDTPWKSRGVANFRPTRTLT